MGGELLKGRSRFARTETLPLILAGVYILLESIPILVAFYQSFTSTGLGHPAEWSLQNYVTAIFASPGLAVITANTLVYALGAGAVGATLGWFFAWVVARTDAPGKWFIGFIPLYSILIPDVARVGGWLTLLAPNSGVLNNLLGTTLFNAYSLPAMIWVYSGFSITLAYIVILPSIRAVDSSLEETALVSGSTPLGTSFRITFRLTLPAFIGGFILATARALVSFTAPTLLGKPGGIITYTSAIYGSWEYKLNPGLASAYSAFLVLGTALLVFAYLRATHVAGKYATIRGRGYRSTLVLHFGRWKYVLTGIAAVLLFLYVALPTIAAFVTSLTPFYTFEGFVGVFAGKFSFANYPLILDDPFFVSGLYNSVYLGFLAAVIATSVALLLLFVARRSTGSVAWLIDFMGTIPITFSDLIIALGLLLAFVTTPLYQTPYLILLGFVIIFVPYAIRSNSASMLNINYSLDDAISIHGGKWQALLRNLFIPLMRQSLAASFVLIFLMALQNVDTTILLTGPGSEYGSVAIYYYFATGSWARGCAGALVYFAVLLTVVVIALRVLKVRLIE